MENTAPADKSLIDKVLKGHQRQVKLSHRLARVGYDTALGKFLRLKAYYRDAIVMIRNWRDFLFIRQQHIGDRYFAVDQAIMHTDHAGVKELMHVEPQLRGNDLGIIRILAPSYLLNNPLSLGTNGTEHTGLRAVFQQALPDPFERTEAIASLIDRFLSTAAEKETLHIGDDLPKFVVDSLHQLVFNISLSEKEIEASRSYIKGLSLASLPNFISRYLLWFLTAPKIRHRAQLVARYKTASNWPALLETGQQYGLDADQVANGLFDMIHIAGTAGTSALLGSVIGVLCLNDELRHEAIAEINTLWKGNEPLTDNSLREATLLHSIILETARLYPPVRFVSQLATEPGEIAVGESICPFQAGTRLLGSIFNANHDGRRYQNPDQFEPTRDFSDLLSWNGDGHERVCPGRSLSTELIKIFCLHLFKHYQWDYQADAIQWDFKKVTAVTPNDLVLNNLTSKPVESAL